jgi:hypothetical protein
VKGIVSIEMACTTTLKPEQLSTLAKIPTLIMFGDHLGDVPGPLGSLWPNNFETCNKFVEQVTAAGGDAQMMYLPKMGIKGNSHMLMQDKNSLQLADLILSWIDDRVEGKKNNHHKSTAQSKTRLSAGNDRKFSGLPSGKSAGHLD